MIKKNVFVGLAVMALAATMAPVSVYAAPTLGEIDVELSIAPSNVDATNTVMATTDGQAHHSQFQRRNIYCIGNTIKGPDYYTTEKPDSSCNVDCECDGSRTCSNFHFCEGIAR